MHTHFLPRRAALAAPLRAYGRIAGTLLKATRRSKVLKEFQTFLGLPNDRLHEMGLARPQILAQHRQFRTTGDTPQARP